MKKHFYILSIVCLIGSHQASSSGVTILGEKLTPLWAQEYIGSDLVKEEMKEEMAAEDTKKVSLAVIDLGFEAEHIQLSEGLEHIDVPQQMDRNRKMRANHGTSVVNLLTGPSKIRATDKAELINLTAARTSGFYSYMLRRFNIDKTYPRVISNSLGWRSEKIANVVEELAGKGTFWFLAAGNGYPEPVRKHERESMAFLVGSFAPSGLTSFESQNHPSLLVLAPANEELLTINGYGEEHLFGATSGATPLVAATAINLISVLPNLDRESFVTIIKKTAFLSVENKLGLKNLPGLLNGYMAFKVARRLKETCSNDTACLKKELRNQDIFQFEITDQMKLRYNCQSFKRANLKERERLLKELRKLSFLKSSFHQKHTACAYRLLGFDKNAEFFTYLSQNEVDLQRMKSKARDALNQGLFQTSYYRYGPYYGDDYLRSIEESPLGQHHQKILKSLPTVLP